MAQWNKELCNSNSVFLKWSESCSVMSNSLRPHGLHSPWNSPGQNTGVGNLSLFQGIFPTQGSNPGLPYCRQILYQLNLPILQQSLKWAYGTGRNNTQTAQAAFWGEQPSLAFFQKTGASGSLFCKMWCTYNLYQNPPMMLLKLQNIGITPGFVESDSINMKPRTQHFQPAYGISFLRLRLPAASPFWALFALASSLL